MIYVQSSLIYFTDIICKPVFISYDFRLDHSYFQGTCLPDSYSFIFKWETPPLPPHTHTPFFSKNSEFPRGDFQCVFSLTECRSLMNYHCHCFHIGHLLWSLLGLKELTKFIHTFCQNNFYITQLHPHRSLPTHRIATSAKFILHGYFLCFIVLLQI